MEALFEAVAQLMLALVSGVLLYGVGCGALRLARQLRGKPPTEGNPPAYDLCDAAADRPMEAFPGHRIQVVQFVGLVALAAAGLLIYFLGYSIWATLVALG